MLGSIAYLDGDEVRAEAFVERAIEVYRRRLEQAPHENGLRAPLVNLLLARDRVAAAEDVVLALNLPLNPIRASAETFRRQREAARRRGLPPMVINTLPKSASESIWNKLARGLGMAQAHLSIGLFPDCCLIPARVRTMAEGGIITKEHIPATAHNVGLLAGAGIDRLVFHVRDPRQATLSWAHFVRDDISKTLLGPVWRKICPPAEVLRGDLAATIDWSIEHYLPLQIGFIEGWRVVKDDPAQRFDVLFLTFELFRTAPGRYFDEVLTFYGLGHEDFAAQAEAETVHLRKGAIDEWRGVFDERQRRRAWELIPGELAAAFGWEP